MERTIEEIANYFTMKRFKTASSDDGHSDKEYFDLLCDALKQEREIAVEKALQVASEKAKCDVDTDFGIVYVNKQSILSLKPQIIEQLNK